MYLPSVSERLRAPLADWYETWRKSLEKGAKEARNIHRQATSITGQTLAPAAGGGRINGSDVAGSLTLEGPFLYLHCQEVSLLNFPPSGSLAEPHQVDGPICILFRCYVHLCLPFSICSGVVQGHYGVD